MVGVRGVTPTHRLRLSENLSAIFGKKLMLVGKCDKS